jgi:hypothetical protein
MKKISGWPQGFSEQDFSERRRHSSKTRFKLAAAGGVGCRASQHLALGDARSGAGNEAHERDEVSVLHSHWLLLADWAKVGGRG